MEINCKCLGTWGPTCRILSHFARLYSDLRLDFLQLLLVLGEPVEDAIAFTASAVVTPRFPIFTPVDHYLYIHQDSHSPF